MQFLLPSGPLLYILKFCLSAGILASILLSFEFDTVKKILGSLILPYLIIATILMIIQIFIAAYRWKLILEIKAIDASFYQTVRLFWIGLLFSQFLPSNFGGDAMRIYYLSKLSDDITNAMNSVFLDRVIGLLSLSILVLATTTIIMIEAKPILVHFQTYFFGLLALCFLFLLVMAIFKQFIHHTFSSRILSFFHQFLVDLYQLIYPTLIALKIWVLSFCIHFITVLSMFVLTISLSIDISPFHLLWATPLTLLFSAVPITISGWGVREGLMVLSLGAVGIAYEASLALSILFGLMLALIVVPGLVFWIFNKSNKKMVNGET